MEREITLRIVVVGPPEGVTFGLQRGKTELVDVIRTTGDDLTFDFPVRVHEDGRFLGPFTQGPPTARFVYVNSGTGAGDRTSPWSRRAKVPLKGVTADLVDAVSAKKGAVL